MSTTPFTPLLPAAELHRLAGEAVHLMRRWRELAQESSEETDHADGRAYDAAYATMRFVAGAAALVGQGEFLEDVARMLATWREVGGAEDDVRWPLAGPIGMLVATQGTASATVEALAQDRSQYIRKAVAENLAPMGRRAQALLATLARDTDVDVRKAARIQLSTVAPVEWWHAWFDEDPAAKAAPEELAKVRDACAALDDPHWAYQPEPVTNAVQRLPDAWALALIERLCLTKALYDDAILRLAPHALRRPGASGVVARLARRLEADDVFRLRHVLAAAWKGESPSQQAARCLELVRTARALPAGERTRSYGPGWFLAHLAASSWPPDADGAPWLEAVLEGPVGADLQDEPLQWALEHSFAWDKVPFTSITGKLLALRLAGYAGRYRPLQVHLDRILAALPWSAVADAVTAAARSEDRTTVHWAAARLAERVRTRVEAGEDLFDVTGELVRDARLRPVLLAQYPTPLVAIARRDFVGRLSFDEMASLLRSIGALYGGVGADLFDDEDDERPARQARARALLGPPELQGPPTEVEWAAWRALREEALVRDDPPWYVLLDLVPAGALRTEDRPFVERALAAAGTDRKPSLAGMARFLGAHGSPEDVVLFERLRAAAADEDTRDDIDTAAAALRARLGLAPVSTAARGLARPPRLTVIDGGGE